MVAVAMSVVGGDSVVSAEATAVASVFTSVGYAEAGYGWYALEVLVRLGGDPAGFLPGAGEVRFVFGMGGVLFGSWWIIAAAFCAAFLRPIRFAFAPLLDGVRRKHFAVLAAIGALVAAAGATLIYYRHGF